MNFVKFFARSRLFEISFISLFDTTFVLYIFCFNGRKRVYLHLLLDCTNMLMFTCYEPKNSGKTFAHGRHL